MTRNILISALASAAIVASAPAVAQHGGGGGGGMGGHGGGIGGGIGVGGGGMGGLGVGMGGNAGGMGSLDSHGLNSRVNSEGSEHASSTGISHANVNSALAGTGSTNVARSGPLAGLTSGTTVYSNGMAVGTVQQIRTTGNGSVALVVVKGANGGLYAVPATKLTLSGGTLSTTARFNGINGPSQMPANASNMGRLNSQGLQHASTTGIRHANGHSVLASGAVASAALPGLTSGLTVRSSTGTTLGKVSQIITGPDGSIRLVIVTSSNGRTVRLSPTTLSISGGVVTTTAS